MQAIQGLQRFSFYSTVKNPDQLVRLWLCDLVDLAAHNGII